MVPVLAAAGLLRFLSPAFAAAPFDPGHGPHAGFRDASGCPRCHPVVGGKPVPGRLLPGSVDFCVGCHADGPADRSHPVGGRPRDSFAAMTIPGDLRLDDDGRMTCLTCHSAHGPYVATVRAYPGQKPENPDPPPGTRRYYRTRYVRRTDPGTGYAVLCHGCHAAP